MPGNCPEGIETKFTFAIPGIDGFKEVYDITFRGVLVEDLEKVSKIAPEPEVVSKNGFRRRWI
jgi:hypothetical protein